jgi:dihydroorotate dehydrogenase
LFEPSTALLRRFRQRLPAMPIIGVGGIDSVERAWRKFKAGADAIQVYSGMVHEGAGLARRLRHGLRAKLEAEGLAGLRQASGRPGQGQCPSTPLTPATPGAHPGGRSPAS